MSKDARIITPTRIAFAAAVGAAIALRVFEPDAPAGLVLGHSGASLVIGLVLLVLGADYLIHGAVRLARGLGVSPFLIGVTVVAFGTSAPELAASIGATVKSQGSLAIGNVMGSNVANVGLILGLTAAIKPVTAERSIIRVDVPLMIGVSLLASFTLIDVWWLGPGAHADTDAGPTGAFVGRIDGILLCAGLIAYVAYNAVAGRLDPEELEHEIESTGDVPHTEPKSSRLLDLLALGAGLVGLYLGAELLVDGSTTIAQTIGVPEHIIGLTLVAFGTSVPELALSLQAARKGHAEIALGNILGSNAFNLLCVLGIASLVNPLPIPVEAGGRDLAVMLGFSVVLWFMLAHKPRLSRTKGWVLFAAYAGYIGFIAFRTLTAAAPA